ncbi:RNase adapter RapZ [Aquabacterium sp.]|uniref:RNase adapter RapZ n=1 Tax=Aquabacterium sp. TaxID=1872578 RepID=UPI0035B119FD
MSAHTPPVAESARPSPAALDIVVVTGISGSGKSVAMQSLEDAGFFCVDNLPVEMLRDFIMLERNREPEPRRVAVSVDVRTGASITQLLPRMAQLRDEGVSFRSIFLDASVDALVHRYSESRRPHPLAQTAQSEGDLQHALIETIQLEQELLSAVREVSTVIDTSHLRPAQLRAWVRNLVEAHASTLTLVFESFAFKHGVPLDADYVFDVRMLPNPHYVRELRPLTGRDAPVAEFLRAQPEVDEMLDQIQNFMERWLPTLKNDQRSYVTVAIGCTGGQHRSVYLAEQLHRRFERQATTLVRHRELGAREMAHRS